MSQGINSESEPKLEAENRLKNGIECLFLFQMFSYGMYVLQ